MNDLLINQLIIQSMNNRISTYSHKESLILSRMYCFVYLVSLLRTVTDCIGRMRLPVQKNDFLADIQSYAKNHEQNKTFKDRLTFRGTWSGVSFSGMSKTQQSDQLFSFARISTFAG